MNAELSGRRALVTGAAQGIGAGIAAALATAGAEVIAADRRAPDDTVAAISNGGGQAQGVVCDISDEGDVAALFDVCVEGGILDITVNAAGILVEAPISEMALPDFDRIMAVNLRGAFLVARGAARTMTQAGHGRIILISSELAFLGRADFSAYCASKAGVVGLTRSLARELAPGILVNGVAPGPVDTPMLALENMSQDWIDKELEIPLGRVGTVDEIAGVVRFLCGPEAGFFTGQTLSPNGGAVMI
ncbi:SDR family NAD(P)-dependent oxidoreductase [Notoacmeibacter marinus]|uniref:SDR family NAD(P)-dependent oxidoreductase n=1 Tax=Notoacmeibacter marinus TaxID=1876515 RepID=UPI000DF29D68|nr:SDR family oxidoreductase [Notoacmeibacter marinus]